MKRFCYRRRCFVHVCLHCTINDLPEHCEHLSQFGHEHFFAQTSLLAAHQFSHLFVVVIGVVVVVGVVGVVSVVAPVVGDAEVVVTVTVGVEVSTKKKER